MNYITVDAPDAKEFLVDSVQTSKASFPVRCAGDHGVMRNSAVYLHLLQIGIHLK